MSDSDMEVPLGPTNDAPPTQEGTPAPAMSGPSWQEQDMQLRELWTQNKTPQEISDALKRSIAAIMTRAARLGLPRRSAPGRKPGSRRAPGDLRMTLPRPPAVRSEEGRIEPQTSTRICLMCLRPFPSLGRHNRICSSCKNSSEYESAVSLSEINIPI